MAKFEMMFDNTKSVKDLASRVVLEFKSGNEKQYLKIGDIVKASGKCTYIDGTIGKVVDVWNNNGFIKCDVNWFYNDKKKANIQSERQSDLQRI